MKVVIATHGHCFDGLASAVVFTRLLQRLEGPGLEFQYYGCGYGVGQRVASEELLSGDQNAILDYRFTASERVTWYFDHHRTAFASDADHAFYERRRDNGRYFFDAKCSSCTKLIRHVAKERFGVHDPALDELVRWADIVDSAAFANASAAIDYSSQVMRLVSVIEHYGNDDVMRRLIGKLLTQPLSDVAGSSEVHRRFRPIGKRHQDYVDAVRQRARPNGRVVFVDLTDQQIDLVGKFVTYALYPSSVYSVVAARLKRGYKISVGYNPWCGQDLDTDISSICARYGGGGHPVVGGIAFADDQGDDALRIAREIVRELEGTA